MQNLIHEFVVLAEHSNLTKAAQALHMSQPGLSKHMHMLEQELGVKLIASNTKPIKLTTIGRAFLARARELDREYMDLTEWVRGLKGQPTCRLTYACSMQYRPGADVVQAALLELGRRFPLLEAINYVSLPESRLAALRAGEADVACCAYSPTFGIEEQGYTSVQLVRDPLVVIAPKSHRLANAGTIASLELDNERIIEVSDPFYSEFAGFVRALLKERSINARFRARGWNDGQGYYALDQQDALCITTLGDIPRIPVPILGKYVILKFDDKDFCEDWRVFYKSDTKDETVLAFVECAKRAAKAAAKDEESVYWVTE